MFRKIFLFIFILNVSFSCIAQIKVSYHTVPDQIKAGEPFMLQFDVSGSNNVQNIILPKDKNLNFLGGPYISQSNTRINGKTFLQYSAAYTAKIDKPGEYKFSAAQVKINSNYYPSEPITLTVIKPSNNTASKKRNEEYPPEEWPEDPKELDRIFKEAVKVEVIQDKKECYVGEPIHVIYKLYTRIRTRSELVKTPSLNGFSVTEIPVDFGIKKKEPIEGKVYEVTPIREIQIIPQHAGTLYLDEMELDHEIFLITKDDQRSVQYNLPASRVIPRVTWKMKVDAQPIVVKPLPDNEPENFSGGVGEFTIQASVPEQKYSRNQEIPLSIKVSGVGNLKLMSPPKLQLPEGWEIIEQRTKDEWNYGSYPLKGSRTFIYTLSTENIGRTEIPSIAIAVFQPSKGTYEQLTTKPISLEIVESSIKKEHTMIQDVKDNKAIYWGLGGLVVVISGLGYTWLRRKNIRRTAVEPIVSPVIEEKNPTISFEKSEFYLQSGNVAVFAESLLKEIKLALILLAKVDETTPIETAYQQLQSYGVNNANILKTKILVHTLERQVYAGIPFEETPEQLLQDAKNLIGEMQMSLKV